MEDYSRDSNLKKTRRVFARRLHLCANTAEDALHDVFIAMLIRFERRPGFFASYKDYEHYTTRSVSNRLHSIRKMANRTTSDSESILETIEELELQSHDERVSALTMELSSLTEIDRAVLRAKADGMSGQEIATRILLREGLAEAGLVSAGLRAKRCAFRHLRERLQIRYPWLAWEDIEELPTAPPTESEHVAG